MTRSRNFRRYTYISGLGVWTFLLVIFSLVLMRLDHRLNSLDKIRQKLFVGVSPIHYAVHYPIQTFKYLLESFVILRDLKKENKELKAKQLILSAKVQKFAALSVENEKLHALLQSATHFQDKILSAQLLSVDLSPFSQQVLLNKGINHDVFVGQPVLDEAGVMGQVISLSPLTSRVLLITDRQSAIPVQINRNGLRAIAVGSGSPGYLSLLYLPDTADIQEGDLLVTSGLGRNFPFGYPVGVVSKIKRVPGEHFLQAFAKPSAGINKSRQVLLLRSNSNDKEIGKLD